MNAAAQRRLTPVLAIVATILGVLLLILLGGAGRGVRWHAPRAAAPLPAVHAVALPPPPPLDSYAAVWQHPLFSSDRKPMASAATEGGVSLGDLELTGIILTPQLRMALLRDKSANPKDAREVRVREGAALPDGSWTLVELQPRAAIFASASGRTELKLPAGAPIDAPAANASGANASTPNPPPPGAASMQRVSPMQRLQPGQAPQSQSPQGPALQRMLKLKAAILKQRARQSGADEGVH